MAIRHDIYAKFSPAEVSVAAANKPADALLGARRRLVGAAMTSALPDHLPGR